MVTKPRDVPWGEVEDLIEDLRQWLISNAASTDPEVTVTQDSAEAHALGALEISGECLEFTQIVNGIRTPTTEEQAERARARARIVKQRLGHPPDITAITAFAESLRCLCMYEARGVRQLLRNESKRMESDRARELMYEDTPVRAAEESISRLSPALELVSKKLHRAVEFERERHRAFPELRRELRPNYDPLSPPQEWPEWVEADAAELRKTVEELEAGVDHLKHGFHAFFEPGRPPFPMTFAGWQELKRDIAKRLEAVGWQLTGEGIQKSQSKSI